MQAKTRGGSAKMYQVMIYTAKQHETGVNRNKTYSKHVMSLFVFKLLLKLYNGRVFI